MLYMYVDMVWEVFGGYYNKLFQILCTALNHLLFNVNAVSWTLILHVNNWYKFCVVIFGML